MMTLGFFGLPGGVEWIVILVVALLIFGRRLPSVMRSVGSSLVEFKRGLRGLDAEGAGTRADRDADMIEEKQ